MTTKTEKAHAHVMQKEIEAMLDEDYANGLRAHEIVAELRADPELLATVIKLLNRDNEEA